MSNKYKYGDYIPNSLLASRLDELADAIVAKMKGNSASFNSEFTCRIPAEMDRDPDLVISEAAKRLRELPVKDNWISVDDRLPEHDFCYCLAVRHYHKYPDRSSVHYAFFTKDRQYARRNNKFYSRKIQGKLSVHFDVAEAGFVVTHWMPLPEPPVSK